MMEGKPTPGQLVTVRQRRFVVTGVAASALAPDPPAPVVEHAPQMEPGARMREQAALPDPTKGFDDPRRLDAFLDAVRWGAVASADVRWLDAPFRRGVTIEDYQHRARSILIVCPAGLAIQWRDQMRDKLGLDFRIVASVLMGDMRKRRGLHVNPWTHFPRLRHEGAASEAKIVATELVLKPPKKLRFSSPDAVRIIRERHQRVVREGKQKQVARDRPVSIRRREVGSAEEDAGVDRLLEMSHQRCTEEVAQGLHDGKTRLKKARRAAAYGPLELTGQGAFELGDAPPTQAVLTKRGRRSKQS